MARFKRNRERERDNFFPIEMGNKNFQKAALNDLLFKSVC